MAGYRACDHDHCDMMNVAGSLRSVIQHSLFPPDAAPVAYYYQSCDYPEYYRGLKKRKIGFERTCPADHYSADTKKYCYHVNKNSCPARF